MFKYSNTAIRSVPQVILLKPPKDYVRGSVCVCACVCVCVCVTVKRGARARVCTVVLITNTIVLSLAGLAFKQINIHWKKIGNGRAHPPPPALTL